MWLSRLLLLVSQTLLTTILLPNGEKLACTKPKEKYWKLREYGKHKNNVLTVWSLQEYWRRERPVRLYSSSRVDLPGASWVTSTYLPPQSILHLLQPRAIPAASNIRCVLQPSTAHYSIPIHPGLRHYQVWGFVLVYSSTLASQATLAAGNIRSVFTSSSSLPLRQPKLFLVPIRSGVFLLLNSSFHYSMPRNLSMPNPGASNIRSVLTP